ncbi:MAG TPA: O-antigen ligase family protein [Burkholderiaceae bacterium]|nr:O-antigen ligase family protein [Burkholderiaceae bacterium]
MLSYIDTIRKLLLKIGCWSVLLCLFSIPIDKPATNIFIFLALACSLFGARAGERWHFACKQPVAIGAVVWLLALEFSFLYAAPGPESWKALGSAVALLYPLIVASLLETQQWRTRGMVAFGFAVSLILLASWSQFFGLLPERALAIDNPAFRYTIFKDYTQQGIEFLVLAAMAASFAHVEQVRKRKIFLWFVAAAAGINVVFLLQSRTSYLIVAPLLAFWAWRLLGGRHASWRRLIFGAALLIACGAVAVMTPRVQQRLEEAKQDILSYTANREATSMGIRLELWKRTVPIIESAPLLGHGLGKWKPEYQAEVKDFPNYDEFRMGHPHQEAMLILSEQGVVGLAVLVVLLIFLGRYIRRLSPPQQSFYASLLLIYITGALANCLWADFSHRHVFMMLLACIPLVAKRNDSALQQAANP